MIIRKANLKDVEIILSAWKQYIKEHNSVVIQKSPAKKKRRQMIPKPENDFRKYITKTIRSQKGLIAIAEKKNKLIGFIFCEIKEYDKLFKLKNYGFINDVFVKKTSRKQGISKDLKDFAMKWFKEKKIKHVALSFNSENSRVHNIYRKWGFQDEYTEMWKEV